MAIASPVALRLGRELADPGTRERAIRELARAFVSAGGVLTHAARELGVSHRALCDWCAAYPELAIALTHARQGAARARALTMRLRFSGGGR